MKRHSGASPLAEANGSWDMQDVEPAQKINLKDQIG